VRAYAARVADSGFRLGIDFGTSNTVAVLRWPDGRTKPLLFDGSPLLPSAVYLDPQGSLLTGRDAVHSARLQPHRFEPYPKRRVEEGTVWLGEREIPVIDLVATVLRRVATEAQRVAGAMPGHVTVTHPAAWGSQRRDALSRAAVAAGLPAPLLVPEPVAAASYFVGTVGTHVPVGGAAVVYDFGAGTFDASVVRRGAGGGFDVLSSEGLSDAGGLDIDATVVGYLGNAFTGREGNQWYRLTHPESDNDRRAAWQLWEDARLAKEMLSRAATTYVHVPLFDESVPVGREQLEQLARTILDRTVTATQLAVTAAGLLPAQLSAIFLVGGSSRIPLAATLLHRAFNLAPTAIEQPELVVAEGALYLAPPVSGQPVSSGPTSGSGPVSPAPISGAPVSPGYTTPSETPGLPPLVPTTSMPVVPPVGPPGGMWTPPSSPPVSPPPISPPTPFPMSPAAVRGPMSQPAPPPARPMAAAMPPVPPPRAQYPTPAPMTVPLSPTAPPAGTSRGRGLIIAGVGAAVLVLLIAIGAAVYGATRNGGGNPPGGSPTPKQVAAPPACGYKLGFLGPLSGPNAPDGQMVRDSAKLAVDNFNNDHKDCRVDLVEADTVVNDDTTKTKTLDFVADDKILGVIGPTYRSEVVVAAPLFDQAKLTMITPSASDTDLSHNGWKVFHRLLGTDTDEADAGTRYLTNILKMRKIYIISDDTDFSTVVADKARSLLGNAVAGTAKIKRSDKDFTSTAKQVVDSGADSVYYTGFYDDGGLFVKQMRAAKANFPIVAANRVFTQAFVDGAGAASEGVVITCPCVPADQADRNFDATFQDHFSRHGGYYGPEAYDATNIFLSGLLAGKSTRADMLAYVNAYEARGVSRSIKFNASGDLDVKSLQIWAYKVRNKAVEKDQVIPAT
jgi:ABC-type branched-subunit amino acid transport system substrate-binding protein